MWDGYKYSNSPQKHGKRWRGVYAPPPILVVLCQVGLRGGVYNVSEGSRSPETNASPQCSETTHLVAIEFCNKVLVRLATQFTFLSECCISKPSEGMKHQRPHKVRHKL